MKSSIQVLFVFGVLLMASCSQEKQPTDSSVFGITLTSLEHQPFSLAELAKQKASVIIFLQPECPFCNSYGKTLRLLDSTLTGEKIQLVGVVAGKNYPEDEIIDYQQKHQ